MSRHATPNLLAPLARLAALARSATFATWFVSCYLLVYAILLWSGNGLLRQIAVGMFLASPVFVLWMVYAVIRHGHPPLRDLAEGEEFGYGDRKKEDLGML